MKWLLLVFALTLSGCGRDSDRPYPPHKVQTNDDRVQGFLEAFYDVCKKQNNQDCINRYRKLEYVKFVEEDVIRDTPEAGNRVGVCYTWTDDKNRVARLQIQLLQKEWNIKSLEGLMYHELGHCLLGKDHTCEAKDPNCIQDSNDPHMMFPQMYGFTVYQDFWKPMVNELFSAEVLALTTVPEDDYVDETKLTLKVQE